MHGSSRSRTCGTGSTISTGGAGTTDGSVNSVWAGVAPTTGVGAENWSVRLTGLITFPTAGVYTFTTNADDGSALWLNDVNLITEWQGGIAHISSPGTFTATTGQQARIRLQYNQLTGPSSLQLLWKIPGATGSVVVPGNALTPGYGLETGNSTDDSAPLLPPAGISSVQVPTTRTSTGFATPWLGQATSTRVDPGGVNLTTTATFEKPGAGFLRQLSSSKPAGVATT